MTLYAKGISVRAVKNRGNLLNLLNSFLYSVDIDSTNQSNRPSTPPPPSPSTPLSTPSTAPYSTAIQETIRDERIQVQTLHNFSLMYSQIHNHLGLSLRQIQYAVRHQLTPKKRSGRPAILAQEEVDMIPQRGWTPFRGAEDKYHCSCQAVRNQDPSKTAVRLTRVLSMHSFGCTTELEHS
jgi:hypothetical protein